VEQMMDIYSGIIAGSCALLTFFAVALGTIRLIPACDSLARWRVGELSGQASRLMMSMAHLRLGLRLWCIALVAIPTMVWMNGMSILSLMAIAIIYVCPEHLLNYLVRRRRTKLRDQLVPAIQGLANAAQAGLTLPQGLVEVTRDTPQPLESEFRRILADYQRGRPLSEAIEEVRQRLQLESFTLFATAVQTSIERGGRINEALLRIANSLREHQRIERKMDADTSAGRTEVLVLSLFPAVFALMIYFMEPGSLDVLFREFAGQVVLLVVIGLVYFGARWALKLMDVQN